MYRTFVRIALASASVMTYSPILAQSDTVELSLSKCLEIAESNSLEIRQSRISIQARELEKQARKNEFLPVLGANIGQSWSFGRSEDNTGVYIDRSSASTSIGISTSVQLFSGLRRYHALKATDLNLRSTLLDYEQAKQDLGIRITQYYYTAILAQETQRAAQRSESLSQELYEEAVALVRAGKWSRERSADLDAQRAEASLHRVEADNLLEQAILDLSLALNLSTPIRLESYDMDRELQEARLYITAHTDVDLSKSIATMPSLQGALLNIEAAKMSVKSAQAGYLPSLSLSLGYSNGYYYQLGKEFRTLNLPFLEQWKQNARTYIGLNLSIPIFDAFRTRQQVRQARLEVASQEISQQITERKILKELSLAKANAKLAFRKIEACHHSLEASRQALVLMQAKFKVGTATPSELSESLARHFTAQIELAKAQSDYLLRVRILRFYLHQ